MFKVVASKVLQAKQLQGKVASSFAVTSSRSFTASNVMLKEKYTIPVDKDHQGGRRKVEIEYEEKGVQAFNREPVIPDASAGTKENPILVPSEFSHRAVGYEDPNTHQLVWFNLYKGNIHWIPSIGLYFKLDEIKIDGHH